MEFTADSYEFHEKAKTNKNGPYFETTVSGVINNISPEILIALETYRYQEFVGFIARMDKRLKFIGNNDAGMILQFSSKEVSSHGGSQNVAIDLTMENEQAAPFIAY